jgi:hypothetical protein
MINTLVGIVASLSDDPPARQSQGSMPEIAASWWGGRRMQLAESRLPGDPFSLKIEP